MQTARVGRGELIAAAAGLVLLVSMFLPWFDGSLTGTGAAVDVSSRTGWEAFGSLFDVLLIVAAVAPVAIAVARASDRLPPLPVEQGLLVLAGGAAAFLAVVWRLLDPPDVIAVAIPSLEADISREIAAFVALAAAAAIAYGGYLQRTAMRRVGLEPTLTGT